MRTWKLAAVAGTGLAGGVIGFTAAVLITGRWIERQYRYREQ